MLAKSYSDTEIDFADRMHLLTCVVSTEDLCHCIISIRYSFLSTRPLFSNTVMSVWRITGRLLELPLC